MDEMMDEMKTSIMDTSEDIGIQDMMAKEYVEKERDNETFVEILKIGREQNEMESTLENVLWKLRGMKPNNESEVSRRYAVVITEMEKVVAYFKVFVVNG